MVDGWVDKLYQQTEKGSNAEVDINIKFWTHQLDQINGVREQVSAWPTEARHAYQ